MPRCPSGRPGSSPLVPLFRSVNPLGTLENVRLYVSAVGPVLWITAWKAVGIWAPLNGTVNSGVRLRRQRHARLRGRDRHVDGGLRHQVRVRRRLGDDLDRIRTALKAGAGSP